MLVAVEGPIRFIRTSSGVRRRLSYENSGDSEHSPVPLAGTVPLKSEGYDHEDHGDPEVPFGPKGANGGRKVVIGNPPFVVNAITGDFASSPTRRRKVIAHELVQIMKDRFRKNQLNRSTQSLRRVDRKVSVEFKRVFRGNSTGMTSRPAARWTVTPFTSFIGEGRHICRCIRGLRCNSRSSGRLYQQRRDLWVSLIGKEQIDCV